MPRSTRHLRPLPGPDPGPGPEASANAASVPGLLVGTVELLASGVRAALVDGGGRIVRERSATFGSPRTASSHELTAVVVAAVRACLADAPVRGVGVASVGLVDEGTGVIRDVHDVPGFRGCPITDLLTAELGVPVFADHHARMQVLGDRWFGHGAGRSAFASVTTGDTLGVGVLHEGHVIAPQGGRSGAHITVRAGGARCSCGNRGCWKTVATTGWLRRRASRAGLGSSRGVADLVASRDPRAEAVLHEYADNLALGLSTIQHLVAPGLYILHGDAAAGGGPFLDRIETTLRAVSSWSEHAEQPRVVVATTAADHVALLGGAGLVLSRTST